MDKKTLKDLENKKWYKVLWNLAFVIAVLWFVAYQFLPPQVASVMYPYAVVVFVIFVGLVVIAKIVYGRNYVPEETPEEAFAKKHFDERDWKKKPFRPFKNVADFLMLACLILLCVFVAILILAAIFF